MLFLLAFLAVWAVTGAFAYALTLGEFDRGFRHICWHTGAR